MANGPNEPISIWFSFNFHLHMQLAHTVWKWRNNDIDVCNGKWIETEIEMNHENWWMIFVLYVQLITSIQFWTEKWRIFQLFNLLTNIYVHIQTQKLNTNTHPHRWLYNKCCLSPSRSHYQVDLNVLFSVCDIRQRNEQQLEYLSFIH